MISFSDYGLLNILQVCDSFFPIGAFTLSNGLETFVQQGVVSTPDELAKYIKSYLKTLPYNDLGVMILAYKHHDNKEYIAALDKLYTSVKTPFEVREGSRKMCSRFLKAWEKMSECENLERYKSMIKLRECEGHHPIAVGLFIADKKIPIKEAATVFTYSLLSAITTNTVKMVPLSQLEGQRVLNESFDLISQAVEKSLSIDDTQIGINGVALDIRAMQHEVLYTRLYMS